MPPAIQPKTVVLPQRALREAVNVPYAIKQRKRLRDITNPQIADGVAMATLRALAIGPISFTVNVVPQEGKDPPQTTISAHYILQDQPHVWGPGAFATAPLFHQAVERVLTAILEDHADPFGRCGNSSDCSHPDGRALVG